MQEKNKKILISFVLLLFVGALIFFSTKTLSFLANDTKVEENSELIYYIDVTYDGIDEYSNISSAGNPVNVYSDLIHVYDKLPEGLEFVRFVRPANDRFEAESYGSNMWCDGEVVNNYNGLYYDESTRTVSFDVTNLEAGCYIRVGVVTTTGYAPIGQRLDFYNTAYAIENGTMAKSPTVHAYIGDETKPLYQVNYEFTGTVPEGATAPTSKSYSGESLVGLEANIEMPGYTFSGWSSSDVTVSNGKFTMPERAVTFRGSFTENPSHTISFVITGDYPESYIKPSNKTFREGEIVNLYTMTGNVYEYEGYEFNGWTSDDDYGYAFQMPNHDITFTGSFTRHQLELCFELDNTVTFAPGNEPSIPPCEYHYPGEKVTLPEMETPEGYKFLGWSEESPFTMPNSVQYNNPYVIVGSFMYYNGSFRPTLTKTLTSTARSFKNGDLVNFDIKVTNTASYPIREVMIRETSPCYFLENASYTLKSETFALISTMIPSEEVTLKAQCVAGNEPVATYVNTSRLVGGLADNYYYLDLDTPIQATASYEVGNITLNILSQSVAGADLSSQTVFELFEDSNLSNSLGTGFSYSGLGAGTYYLKQQRAATGYQILANTLPVNISSTGVVTIPNYRVTGSEGAYSVTIVNEEINLLPSSGGPGTLYYVIIGLLVVILGSTYYYIDKKRKA